MTTPAPAPAVQGQSAPMVQEATIQDLKLAEALGYSRPTDIRKLIKRHTPSLERIGSLRQRGVMIEAGKGARRQGIEYHLTKAQAAFITSKAGTARADTRPRRWSRSTATSTARARVSSKSSARMPRGPPRFSRKPRPRAWSAWARLSNRRAAPSSRPSGSGTASGNERRPSAHHNHHDHLNHLDGVPSRGLRSSLTHGKNR